MERSKKVTERTRIRNHPERAVPEETEEILSQGVVAHLGFIQDGVSFVIPFSYHYDADTPDLLYLHGSVRSRALRHVASGAPVCITVTLTDGLVYSRKAMNRSMNYRCATVFGVAREITDDTKKMVQQYFPGRTVGHDCNAPAAGDLGATALMEVKIEEWNARARRGNPTGPDDGKPDALGSAGVIDFREL